MSGKAVRETLGFLGVVASLVFVGTELRQNTRQARAASRQAIVDDALEVVMARATNPELNRQIIEVQNAATAEAVDCQDAHAEACIWLYGVLRHHENVFIQYREGVVDQSVFDSYAWRNNGNYAAPFFPSFWATRRQAFDPDFVAAFEAEYGLAP